MMDQGGGQVEAAFHPAGIGGDKTVHSIADVYQAGQFLDAPVDFAFAQAVETALEAQEFAAGLLVVQRGILEGDADAATHLVGLSDGVVSGDGDAAGGGKDEGDQHSDHGGFAGAVGPQEAVDFAPLHGEIDVVYRLHRPEAAHQSLGFDGVGVGGSSVH